MGELVGTGIWILRWSLENLVPGCVRGRHRRQRNVMLDEGSVNRGVSTAKERWACSARSFPRSAILLRKDGRSLVGGFDDLGSRVRTEKTNIKGRNNIKGRGLK